MYWLIAVAVVLLLLYFYTSREDFATKSEKANAMSEWFATSSGGGYNAYKKAVPGSDIVEYERVRSAVANGASASGIARII